jgi:anti-sigma factor RsiW
VSALDRVIEIELVAPCAAGEPMLHRLVDGELPSAREKAARAHLRRCARCRRRFHLLELEEQALREFAAPTPRRFVALWSERLQQKLAGASAEEALRAPAQNLLPGGGSSGSGTTRSSRSSARSPTRSRTV